MYNNRHNQDEIRSRLVAYLDIKHQQSLEREDYDSEQCLHVKSLMKNSKGFCFGLALCVLGMYESRKIAWWYATLAALFLWDGESNSLKNNFEHDDNERPITLDFLFERLVNYLFYYQSAHQYIRNSELQLNQFEFFSYDDPEGHYYDFSHKDGIKKVERLLNVSGSFSKEAFSAIISHVSHIPCLIHTSTHTIILVPTVAGYHIYCDSNTPQIAQHLVENFICETPGMVYDFLKEYCGFDCKLDGFFESVCIQSINIDRENRCFDRLANALEPYSEISWQRLNFTGLHSLCIYNEKELGRLVVSNALLTNGYLQKIFAQALCNKNSRGQSGLHYMIQYVPLILESFFDSEIFNRTKSLQDGVVKALLLISNGLKQGFEYMCVHAPNALMSLCDSDAFSKHRGLQDAVAQSLIRLERQGWPVFQIMVRYAPLALQSLLESSAFHVHSGLRNALSRAIACKNPNGWCGLQILAKYLPHGLTHFLMSDLFIYNESLQNSVAEALIETSKLGVSSLMQMAIYAPNALDVIITSSVFNTNRRLRTLLFDALFVRAQEKNGICIMAKHAPLALASLLKYMKENNSVMVLNAIAGKMLEKDGQGVTLYTLMQEYAKEALEIWQSMGIKLNKRSHVCSDLTNISSTIFSRKRPLQSPGDIELSVQYRPKRLCSGHE